MQTDDQERPGQQGDPPQTDSEAPHGALTDADSSQCTGEERLTCGSPFDEEGAGTGGAPSESITGPPLRMQSLLKQVRSQIRAKSGLSHAKTGLLDLMQQIKEREVGTASLLSGLSGGAGGGGAGVSEAGGEGGTLTNGEQGETAPEATAPLLPSSFEEELEATRITLRGEFEEQISQLRAEMQAYADRAVSDVEGKMRNAPHPLHAPAKGRSREQTDGKTADKKQKPLGTAAAAAVAPALTGRRSRVLTRTMTTIVTKTCAPVIVGPRAKSETLCGCRDSGALQMREADLRFIHPQDRSSRPPQGRRALPPVIQPVHRPGPPRQKPVWTMAQTGRHRGLQDHWGNTGRLSLIKLR
ncbi:unnamed protein product [Gadus morhua 'NCC']